MGAWQKGRVKEGMGGIYNTSTIKTSEWIIIILKKKKKRERVLNLCVHLKSIYETAQAIGSMHFQNSTKSLKDISSQKRFHYTAMLSTQGWVGRGAPGQMVGLDRPHDPGTVQDFGCPGLKMQSNAECKSFDHWVHPGKQNPQVSPGFTELIARLTGAHPASRGWSVLKNSKLFLNQKRVHRRKRYPRRNKYLWPRNTFSTK